jgi:hypothetical protein
MRNKRLLNPDPCRGCRATCYEGAPPRKAVKPLRSFAGQTIKVARNLSQFRWGRRRIVSNPDVLEKTRSSRLLHRFAQESLLKAKLQKISRLSHLARPCLGLALLPHQREARPTTKEIGSSRWIDGRMRLRLERNSHRGLRAAILALKAGNHHHRRAVVCDDLRLMWSAPTRKSNDKITRQKGPRTRLCMPSPKVCLGNVDLPATRKF